jgi:hypothetical protein
VRSNRQPVTTEPLTERDGHTQVIDFRAGTASVDPGVGRDRPG